MLNYIWGAILLISIICGVFTGKTAQLSQGALNGAQEAIELLLTMCGMMCLWSGLMAIAERGGITSLLAKAFSPVLKGLFPQYKDDKKPAAQFAPM